MLNRFAALGPPVVAVFAIILWFFIHLPTSNLDPHSASTMSAFIPRKTLNPALFNESLVTAIHDLWFTSLPRHATAPIPALTERWFGMGATPEAKAAFDGTCRSLFLPALTSINPTNYPLPPFTSHTADRALAPEISLPFRALPMLKTNNEEEKTDIILAMILLLDQMPRNIFRQDEAKVVYEHYDRISRSIVYSIIHQYSTKDLNIEPAGVLSDLYNLHHAKSVAEHPVRATWFFLTLMHSESIEDHDLFMSLSKAMQKEAESRGDKDGAGWAAHSIKFEDQHRAILDQFGRYPHRNRALGRQTTKQEKEWLEGGGATFGAG